MISILFYVISQKPPQNSWKTPAMKSVFSNVVVQRFYLWLLLLVTYRSSHPEMFLRKSVLKIYIKFIGEHPCRSVISIKLLCNLIEITLWLGFYLVNLLHIFITPFLKTTIIQNNWEHVSVSLSHVIYIMNYNRRIKYNYL